MDQNIVYKQKSHKKANQIVQNLYKYKSYCTKLVLEKNYEPQQKQHIIRIMESISEKVQLDMLQISDYLQEKQQQSIATIIEILVDIVKLNKLSEHGSETKIFNHMSGIDKLFCFNCKIAIQKSRINRMKNKIGLTEVLNYQQAEQINHNINKLYDDDGFIQQKHNLYLASLQFHITELVSVIEKKIFGKAAHFLAADTQSFINKNRQIIEQETNFAIADKQFAQIQKYRAVFNQKFIEQLKVPIQNTVLKILNNIQMKNKRKNKDLFVEKEVQTVYKTQNQVNVHLEQRITHLQNQIVRLRSAKVQSQKNVYKYLERQAQLKKQLSNVREQKIILQQKYKKYLQTSNQLQSKLKYEINSKASQIQRLQKNLYQLRQKKSQQQTSKFSTKSIQSKKALSRTHIVQKVVQRDSSRFNNQRPSLDMKVLQQQAENSNISRFSRNGIKYSQIKRNKRLLDSSVIRQVKIMDTHQQISDSNSQKTKTNIASKIRIQIKKKLTISQQINLKIDNTKFKEKSQENVGPLIQNQANKSIKNVGKRVKTIRMLKPTKKQTNERRQYSMVQQKQKVQNFSFNNTFRLNQYNSEENDRHKIFAKNLYEVLRLKTQPFEGKQNKTNDKNRSLQKLKPTTLLIRQVKSREQQKTVKQVSELMQIRTQNIILFGNDKIALQYQKNAGIWAHLITPNKISVDVENTNECTQIQKYFKYLQQNNVQKYIQYIKFLVNPSTFLQLKKRSQNQQMPVVGSNTIKQIFTKIIRFHKISHKNCNHVVEFLQFIGFYQF